MGIDEGGDDDGRRTEGRRRERQRQRQADRRRPRRTLDDDDTGTRQRFGSVQLGHHQPHGLCSFFYDGNMSLSLIGLGNNLSSDGLDGSLCNI